MLTPIEIQNKVFKSGIGYDKKDVEAFIKEVLASYESLYKENVELNDKVGVLSEGIQYYKSIEKTLQKALVLAERTSDETKQAAMVKAKAIEDEAHSKAKLIIADAKNELDQIHLKTIEMIRQYDLYKAQFKQLASTQLEVLSSSSFNINIADLEAFQTDFVQESMDESNLNSNEESSVNHTEYINHEKNEDTEKIDVEQLLKGVIPDVADLKGKPGTNPPVKSEEDSFEFIDYEE